MGQDTEEEPRHDDDDPSDRVGSSARDVPGDRPVSGELQTAAHPQAGSDGNGVAVGGPLPEGSDEEGGPFPGLAFTTAQLTASYSGPLPAPADFAGYEAALPGAADRILSMAERRQEAEIENQRTTTRAEAFAFVGAAWGVSFFPWLLAAITVALFVTGQPATAAVTALATAFAAGPQIISATRSHKDKKTE